MVYNPNGSGGVHQDQVLTNISLAYKNNAFVGDALAPVVNVKKQSDKYYIFGREGWIPETSDLRAPGSVANEIEGLAVSFDTYYATEHALQTPVHDEERQNVDSPLAPEADATDLVTNKILLGRELAIKNFVTDTTKYATGLSITLSGTAQWSDYTNSDPIAAFRTAFRAMHARALLEPNLAIIPYQVMSVLQDHPKLMARIQYTDRAILTPELIASLLGIPKIIVPGVAVGAGSGFAMTTSYLWGKDVILAYVPSSPGLRVPAFMYEFVWGYPQTQLVDRWREEPRKSDLIRVSRRYDLKMIGVETNPASGDYGKSITGYIFKNAIA